MNNIEKIVEDYGINPANCRLDNLVEFNDTTNDDYRRSLEIYINGKLIFSVSDGEPEDNSLYRNFSDCYSVVTLLEQFYILGKNGYSVKFKHNNS